MSLFKKKLPKYKIGDMVYFVTKYDNIYYGTIWKIQTSLFHEPVYQINYPRYKSIDVGENYSVSESNIIRKRI